MTRKHFFLSRYTKAKLKGGITLYKRDNLLFSPKETKVLVQCQATQNNTFSKPTLFL